MTTTAHDPAAPADPSPLTEETDPPSPLTEETDPLCLPPARAAELLAAAPWRRFAALGDSLSAGVGDPSPGYASLGWPDRLADVLRRVRPDLAYHNTGVVGATAEQTLADQLDAVAAFRPDLLHVSCGANDLFRRKLDFALLEKTLRLVYERAAATGARLTTFAFGRAFAVPSVPDWGDRIRALNALIRELARTHDAVLVDFWDHPLNTRPNLLSADRIHFNASGQAIVAAELVRELAALLARTDPRRADLRGTGGGRTLEA
ncbi:SGNH/GDSL hydrolase family protein [Streptomyces sp. G45]|uniref:SGNH/GDSL hydrolase family protein n=1 Tax=Streptomyces sp. G45 TaxID=3406627 RepID=UPI003C27A47F